MVDTCPHCNADLRAGRIPQEDIDLGYYGPPTTEPKYYYSTVGVEIRGVYDGTLFWLCPACGGSWNRWPEGHYLHALAEKYMAEREAEMTKELTAPEE